MKDTVGMSEISGRLVQTITADATDQTITVTGDTRHLLDYFLMFDGTIESEDRVSFLMSDPDFTYNSLVKLTNTMGYVLNVTQNLQALLTPPEEE